MRAIKCIQTVALALMFSGAAWAQGETTGEVSRTTAGEDGRGSLVISVAGAVADRADDIRDQGLDDDEADFGGGVLVEANINDRFGIETGLIYLNRVYDTEAGGLRLVQEVHRLHVPIMARFWMGDVFSLAAGPYASFSVEDEETTLEVGDEPIANLSTSADEDVEFGLDAAATLNFAINDKTGLFVEGRYSAPFDEESDEEADILTGLLGLKFDI